MTLHMVMSNVTASSHTYENPRVGAYELLETLGRGNFGKVRRARHIVTKKQYAIKIVDTDVLKQDLPGNLDIRREMSILRGLQHPNIVYLHEVMVSKSRVYMVMDLANGGDFFQLVRQHGRLPQVIARKYFRQLVDAVSYCHDNGVYHRDLKPENMLLTSSSTNHADLKVTDFGFSAMKDHGGALLRTNCGSPHYCAPEVWNGTSGSKGYDGAKSDAFSIGVILYVLLTGGQPFYDVDEDKLLQKVDRCQVHYPKDMSKDAVDLLSKLLVRDPQKRWGLKMVKRHVWYLAASIDEIVEMDVADVSDASDETDFTDCPTITSSQNTSSSIHSYHHHQNHHFDIDQQHHFITQVHQHHHLQEEQSSQPQQSQLRHRHQDIHQHQQQHHHHHQGSLQKCNSICQRTDCERCTNCCQHTRSLMCCADGWSRLPLA